MRCFLINASQNRPDIISFFITLPYYFLKMIFIWEKETRKPKEVRLLWDHMA